MTWAYIEVAKEALSYCTPQTSRAMWKYIYRRERLLKYKLYTGTVGHLYGTRIVYS